MPVLNSIIDNVCVGDARRIHRFVSKIETLDPVAKAWFTVRRKELDSVAIFQKVITTSDVNSQGQIIDTGASNGTAELLFRLGSADTVLLVGDYLYYFDISIKFLASGELDTPEKGVLIARRQITTATV